MQTPLTTPHPTSHCIAVLMTCFNRRDKTIACLNSLFAQRSMPSIDVFLVDDASTDGTRQAVESAYPNITTIKGTGSLYWAGGMRKAWEAASSPKYTAYLWLNDDIVLDEDAVFRLLSIAENLTELSILGGAMKDPSSSETTYSGSNYEGPNPFKYKRVQPASIQQTVDVLNGNFLYIPRGIVDKIGIMASYVVHHAGDYEYCYRAALAGYKSILLPGHFGVCSANPPGKKLKGLKGLKRALSPKYMPLSMGIPLYRSRRRYGWWIWLSWYYLKAFVSGC